MDRVAQTVGTYIIAEIGSTHDGSFGNAVQCIRLFAGCGAHAIKFQDHRWEPVHPDQDHPNPHVREKRRAYYERIAFTPEQWGELALECKQSNVHFIVSPFSVQAVKEQTSVDAFKVASGQVTNIPLLEAIRETGKPVYLSGGMSGMAESVAACEVLPRVVYMHCTSEYPCLPEHVGLNNFTRAVAMGFSDHTMGFAASLAAITLGVRVVERHVTLSRELYGSDAAHSLEPDEFRRFVNEVLDLDRMLANPVNKDKLVETPQMQRMRDVFLAKP
jgi:sialic acid synthase SpsE